MYQAFLFGSSQSRIIDNIFEIKMKFSWQKKAFKNRAMKIIMVRFIDKNDQPTDQPPLQCGKFARKKRESFHLITVVFIKHFFPLFGSLLLSFQFHYSLDSVVHIFSWHSYTHIERDKQWKWQKEKDCEKELQTERLRNPMKIRTFKCKWNSRNTFPFRPNQAFETKGIEQKQSVLLAIEWMV